ncbi:MAG: hypothetical protein HYX74_00825 [Acidobacteria bacterium]|nr:hypothetical protein [Acidobacteriota bacterium]
MGATFAIRGLDEWTVPVLSARCWNLWWPVHVATYQLFGVETVRLPEFSQKFGVNPKIIAAILLLGICGASLVFMLKRLETDRIYLFLTLAIFGYAYTMVQVNVQYNQFFVFLPPLILVSLLNSRLFSASVKVTWPWFLQLLAYGGLGRDFCCGAHIFSYFGLNKAYTAGTLLVAAANAWIWLGFCRQYFASKFNAGPARV